MGEEVGTTIMRFIVGFSGAFCVTGVLFLLPTYLTWEAPFVDGQRKYGFPVTFYAWGGLCPESNVCAYFSPWSLFIDLLIVVWVPALVGILVQSGGR